MRGARSIGVLAAILFAGACSSSTMSGDAVDDGGGLDATLDALGDADDASPSSLDSGGAGFDAGDDLGDASTDAPVDANDAGASVVLVARCPLGTPDAGVPCDSPGLWCEYGGGAHLRCSTSAYCGKATWSIFPPEPSCTLTNAAACPAAYGEPTDASCPLLQGSCDYDAGRCACVACTTDDGGQNGGQMQWFCRGWGDVQAYSDDSGALLNLTNACPANRPQLGTACDAGFECGYDACYGVSLGPYEWCDDGVWGRGPQTDLCNPPSCR